MHLNINLTDVQKFSYLKSLLESDAARMVDGFALTNSNYARAIDLMKERYGQQHKITHATMQTLLQLPAPSNSLHSLRHYYDKMEIYIRGLEFVGQYQETYGSLLVPVVLDKMPAEVRRHLSRERGDSNWPLNELRRAINREIQMMEAGSAVPQLEVDAYGTAGHYTRVPFLDITALFRRPLNPTSTTGKRRHIAKHISPLTAISFRMWISEWKTWRRLT